jgi:hypothetical protein
MTPEPSGDAAAAHKTDPQDLVLRFLDGSEFGAAKGGRRIDTHASVVFLGGDRALKIKRAVRLPFLDYSTLERRKLACDEELKVNAINAPELYRRVVAITRNNDGTLEVDGAGTPIEWAVEMVRFDEELTLDRLAEVGTIRPVLAEHLADAILQSHAKAPRSNGETWLASIPSIIDRNTAKFRAVHGLDVGAIDQLHVRSHDFLSRFSALLGQRARQGLVRRCHGDLHLANIALVESKPRLFDAIEFDAVIATADILYDLAFTLMDLVHFRNGSAANILFNRYLAGSPDENLDGLGMLPLFLSMRAAIRSHVLYTKSEQSKARVATWRDAKGYFDLARRLIMPKPPLLVAIGGLSGTGKSVLARSLAGSIEPPPGAVIVRSDVVRKRLFDVRETTKLPEEAYQSGTTLRVYEAVSDAAQRVIAQGLSVIIDASFMREEQRRALLRLTREHGISFLGLFLTADLATRLARIAHRRNDPSDATRDVALKQEATAIGSIDWNVVDASGTPDDTLRQSIAVLESVARPGRL